MAINKVVYGTDTLMDITDTTATSEDVANGKVFYSASGVRSTGSATASVTDVQLNGTSVISEGIANLQTEGTYSNTNKLVTKNYCVPRVVNVTSAQRELSSIILNNGTSVIISSVNNTDQTGAILNMSPGNITFSGGASGTDNIQIHGIATPTNDTDVANKAYVDNSVVDTSAAIAPEYIPMTAYSIGDYVMHEGKLYVYSADVVLPTPAWIPADWTQTSVSEILGNINTTLGGI